MKTLIFFCPFENSTFRINRLFNAIFTMLALATVLNATTYASTGVVIINKPSYSDKFARSFQFKKIEKHPATISITTDSAEKISIPHINIKTIVEYIPVESLSFLDSGSSGKVKEELLKLQSLTETYPSAKPILSERISLLTDILKKISENKVFFQQKWISRTEYQTLILDHETKLKTEKQAIEAAQSRLADEQLKAAIESMKALKAKKENDQLALEKQRELADLRAKEAADRERIRIKEESEKSARTARWKAELGAPPIHSSDRFIVENLDKFILEFSSCIEEFRSDDPPKILDAILFEGLQLKPKIEIGQVSDYSLSIHRSADFNDIAIISLSKLGFAKALAVVTTSTNQSIKTNAISELVSRFTKSPHSVALESIQIQTAASILRSKFIAEQSSDRSIKGPQIRNRLGTSNTALFYQSGFFWKKSEVESMIILYIW